MKRRNGLIALACVVASAVFVGTALAASTVTARYTRGGGIDFSSAPPDQQPPCLMAIGGVVNWTAKTLEHANANSDGTYGVWGNDRVDFTAGEYTASVNFTYQGSGVPDANGEVITSSTVNVDFVSKTTPGVIKTTFRFLAGAIVGEPFGVATFSLAGPPNYSDVVCR